MRDVWTQALLFVAVCMSHDPSRLLGGGPDRHQKLSLCFGYLLVRESYFIKSNQNGHRYLNNPKYCNLIQKSVGQIVSVATLLQ